MPRPLTPKQQRFVTEYLVDLNASAAARRAGYSARTAKQQGARLLTNVDVRAALKAAQAERAIHAGVTAAAVLDELRRVAFRDTRKAVSWGPRGVEVLDSATLDADTAAAVAEVSQTVTESGGSLRVKFHDKVAALQLLGKHLGLFVERHEHLFPRGLPLSAADAERGRAKVEEYRKSRTADHADARR